MRGVFSRGRGLIGRMFLAALLVLLFGTQVWAQSAAMQSGLNWLAGNQTAEGYWPSAEVGEFHATAEVVKTLTLLSPASSALSTGRAWLATQDSSPTDFLARSIVAGTGADIAALVSLRASSGAWGGDADFAETNLDTPLALQALKAANHSDLTVLNPALVFLITSQNADGGWGLTKGGDSSVHITAVVSATLQQFPQMTAIATAVSRATGYLLAHQNLDGGFGSATSSVYETALAHAALVAVSTNEAAMGSAVNYLTAAQSANGSWNDDAYSTALALVALYLFENRPASPPPPPAGGTITGTVVDATTNLRLSGVAIVLASDPLINTTTDNAGSFTLSNVPPGSQQVNFSLAGYKPVSTTTSVAVETTVNLGTVELVSNYSTGTIAGTITDPAGNPLNGVTVSVTGAWDGTVTTDTDGSYLFTYVTPGEVTVAATKAGFESVSAAGSVYARTTLTFSPRMSTTPAQATTGTLVGRVIGSTWDLPIDHLPGEKGVTVTVSGGISVAADPGNRGVFTIPDLAPGTYQVVVGMNGFATQTFRVVIAAGVTTDLGTIRLVMTISKMALIGKVTDAVSGAPIAGAAVTVANSLLASRTDASGTYAIAGIDHPAEITVRAAAAGYTGRTFLIRTQPWTQTMDIALTPRDGTAPPTGSEVGVTVQTDKATYVKSDTIGVTVNLWNRVGQDYATTLHIKVTDPSGSVVFDTPQELNLTADATLLHALNLTLPLSAPGGTYKVWAEALDANGLLLGSGTTTFGVTTSRITVTPKPPAILASGDNTIDFVLANVGTVAVTNGLLDVTLTDPDGEVVATTSQSFALGLGESTTLSMPASIPALKFGTYLLSYIQSDATIAGAPTEVSLPCSLAIAALYDDNSHRIRSMAGLTVTLANLGRFNLDPAGAGLPVAVTVPDADYAETKLLKPVPGVGNSAGSALLYQFTLPETLTAGLHPTTISVTLPSGSTQVQTAQLAILESSLALAPVQNSATAGEILPLSIANNGGVDTSVAYTLSLLDAKAALIAEGTGTDTVRAGESLALTLAVPAGAVEGSYQVTARILDQKTGAEQMIAKPVAITGVKGSLQVQTDKDEYLASEDITALSSIVNTGTELQNGNLHLQVVSTTGTRTQKAWTSQEDFQTGIRNGVDTYGVNDWIVPDDDFDQLDGNKWQSAGNVSIRSGKVFLDSTISQAMLNSRWKLEGDFDIQIDFSQNNSYSYQGPQLAVGGDNFVVIVHNNQSSGDTGDIRINGTQYYSANGIFRASGKLRITRVADTVATYYWNGSAWAKINEATSSTVKTPCKVMLYVWRSSTYPIGASAECDNFRVNKGQILTENQTVGSVRLLPLNDNFDDGILNKDRWAAKVEENFGTAKFTSTGTTDSYLYHNIMAIGDFSAIAVFKNYSATPTATDDGRYILYAKDSTSFDTVIYFNRWSWKIGEKLNSMSRINGVETGNEVNYPSGSGRLRLRRAGNIAYSEYWSGTSWQTLLSRSSFPTTPLLLGQYTTTRNKYPIISVELDSFTLNKGIYATSGTITLKHDTGSIGSHWGKLLFSSSQPSGTSLKFRTRTADSEADLANALWGDYVTSSGTQITNPAARWIEVEAAMATTNANVTPLLHDLTVTYDVAPGEVLWQTDVPVDMAAGAVSDLSNAVGTLGVTGKLYLQGTLISSTGQEVATAQSPFYIEQGAMTVLLAADREIYRPGENVTVSGEVRNRSTVDAVALSLRVEDPAAVGTELYGDTFDLPAQGSHPFTFVTTAGTDGLQALTGTVTQNGTLLEEASIQYEVASPTVAATLSAPEAAGNDPFAITLHLTNSGKVAAATHVQVTEGSAVVGVEDVTIPAGESRLLSYPYQIASTAEIVATISGDLEQTLSQTVTYVAAPINNTVTAKIVTDKIAYNPNDTVALTGTVTASAARENLTTLMTVTNSQGQGLFSTTNAIANLVQGQAFTINGHWNVGTTPAGTYLVTLQVFDAHNIVVSKDTCDLTINSITQPAILLKGKVALDTQNILSGEPIAVSYSVTNVGNIDLANVDMTVQTVTLDDQGVFQTTTSQAPLAMGATVTFNGAIDTVNLSARDYLVVLRASIDGVEETLAGTYFRVEGAPTAPALAAPANGVDVMTFTPALVVSNAADPNDDRLTYEFEVYTDSGLTTLAAAGTAAETAGTTAWTAAAPLDENRVYFWRVRAYDGWLYGPWTTTASFRINTVDEPPTAPNVSSPADGTVFAVTTPTLTVTNAMDPDSSALTYNFILAHDPEFTQLVASDRVIEGDTATTSWTVPLPLDENGWYYWRTQAEDQSGPGPWSASAMFQVNTANDPPSMPAIVTPAANTVLTVLSTGVVASNATDPDSPMLSYYFEADSATTFDSANLIRSEAIAEGQGATSWSLSGLLDNTWYHLRVKASDGQAESPWSPLVDFFANTVNDPPTIPILDNPSSGSGVTTFTPTLSVRNAMDLDGDVLTYDFEVYADAALTTLIARVDGVAETPQTTTWALPVALTENQTYFWRSRASDGALQSAWMPPASFLVNTANDAPSAPMLLSPAEQTIVTTQTPTLTVGNAIDPDSDGLSYDFEIFSDGILVASISDVPEGYDGTTAVKENTPLADNTAYIWRTRAFDGERYGAWMDMASFTVIVPRAFITAGMKFEPETLNKKNQGQAVTVTITLPPGYRVADIDPASLRLEETIPAEPKPITVLPDQLLVKFDRSAASAVLPAGEQVPVHITGTVLSTPFEGVDVIRVLDK